MGIFFFLFSALFHLSTICWKIKGRVFQSWENVPYRGVRAKKKGGRKKVFFSLYNMYICMYAFGRFIPRAPSCGSYSIAKWPFALLWGWGSWYSFSTSTIWPRRPGHAKASAGAVGLSLVCNAPHWWTRARVHARRNVRICTYIYNVHIICVHSHAQQPSTGVSSYSCPPSQPPTRALSKQTFLRYNVPTEEGYMNSKVSRSAMEIFIFF